MEYKLQFISFLKLLWIVGFSFLYGLGGIDFKALRRYAGAAWIALGIFSCQKISHAPVYTDYLFPVLLCLALHKGYGGESSKTKIGKRVLVGVLLALTSIPLAWSSGMWGLYGYHSALIISASVVFGVFNPFKNARDEETCIATAAVWLPMFMV